jgi:hypothetical protein
MRWAGYVARIGELINAYIILVRIPERKATFGRPRRSYLDNINLDLRN